MMASLLMPAALALMGPAIGAAAQMGPADPSRANAWQIGPIIRGRNHSVGMPLHPTPGRRSWSFDFPYPNVRAGHVHYLTFNHGPLTGKRRIVMRYRIEAAPGVRFVPREHPDMPATISLFFQRRGDNWNARGRYQYYRWYAPDDTVVDIAPGLHRLSVSLDDSWISVYARTPDTDPSAWREALADTDRVGFVLGSRSARGHGVYATGPARFTLLSFEVF